MDNYTYTPFINNSLLRRALARPAAQAGSASSTAPAQGLVRALHCAMLLSRPQNHLAFDCRGDFRKDEAARSAEAFSYGVEHEFRQNPYSWLGADQVKRPDGTWQNEFRASSGKNHPSEGSSKDLAERVSSKFGQKPPVGRIERGLGGTSFEQVRAKTTHRKDRTRDWQNEFRASSGKNHPPDGSNRLPACDVICLRASCRAAKCGHGASRAKKQEDPADRTRRCWPRLVTGSSCRG